jgi:hypothetical protein
LKTFLSPESQKTMVEFIGNLREEVETDEKWGEICKKADEEISKNPINEKKINRTF